MWLIGKIEQFTELYKSTILFSEKKKKVHLYEPVYVAKFWINIL